MDVFDAFNKYVTTGRMDSAREIFMAGAAWATTQQNPIKQDPSDLDSRTLEAHMKKFHDDWAPHNTDYDSRWHAEFYMLVRRIYQDAQAPFLKAAADAFAKQPVHPIIIEKLEVRHGHS
jgi:hypothetical protein